MIFFFDKTGVKSGCFSPFLKRDFISSHILLLWWRETWASDECTYSGTRIMYSRLINQLTKNRSEFHCSVRCCYLFLWTPNFFSKCLDEHICKRFMYSTDKNVTVKIDENWGSILSSWLGGWSRLWCRVVVQPVCLCSLSGRYDNPTP